MSAQKKIGSILIHILFIILIIIVPLLLIFFRLILPSLNENNPILRFFMPSIIQLGFKNTVIVLITQCYLFLTISTYTHEFGHKYIAEIISNKTIKVLITSICHTGFQGIENIPSWKKRIICLGGIVHSVIKMTIFLTIEIYLYAVYSNNEINLFTLTHNGFSNLALFSFILITLVNFVVNLFPHKSKGKPNDGYYFLYPDEIKDEEF